MLNLARFSTRVAGLAIAGALSACSAITFGIANAPTAFGPFERTADVAYGIAGFSKAARGSAPTLDQAVAFLGTLTSPSSTARTDPLQ